MKGFNLEKLQLKSKGKEIGPRSIDIKGGIGVVANSYENSISFLDLINLNEYYREYIGPNPKDIKFYKKYVCILCNEINSIILYNVMSKTIDFVIPSGSYPESFTIDSKNDLMLVSNLMESTVSCIDLKNRKLDKVIKVGEYPSKIIFSKDKNLFYVCETNIGEDKDGFIGIYSINDFKLIKRIKVGIIPSDIFEYNGKIYVTNFGEGTVRVINIKTGREIKKINLGGMLNKVIKTENEMYISDYINGILYVIDEKQEKLKTIAIGNEPNAMILVSSNH